MAILNLRIDDRLEADIKRLAAQQQKSKSELARDLIRRRLAVEQFRALRRKLQPYAEAAGYISDGEFFRDIS